MLSRLTQALNRSIVWPYNLTPDAAIKKTLVLTAGLVVGSKLVTMYFKPLDAFYSELESGKSNLLREYKRRIRRGQAGRNKRTSRGHKPLDFVHSLAPSVSCLL
ncbi:hypothetical protein M3Y99_01862800 [Aphelenchoides fujianensis]|nr:hypothetical protein M3Y99_01862800 [Aphelenchoides fujianensis]